MSTLKLTVIKEGQHHKLCVKTGSNLRQTLLKAGLRPYTRYTQKLICGGHGVCATCVVWILQPEIEPTHWHDRLTRNYGYARLSCQITILDDTIVELDSDKIIWGSQRK